MASPEDLERRIVGGLADAQDAYEEFVSIEGWKARGFDSFADWWSGVVVPTMRSLSMRPTREIAARVVERVREEESSLPPAQRRTQAELAELAGVHRTTLYRQDRPEVALQPQADLDNEDPAALDVADPLPVEVARAIGRRIAERRAEVVDDETADGLDDAARAQDELDAAMSETAARFRRNFSGAVRQAVEVLSFDPERVVEVYSTDYDRSIERAFFYGLERFIDQVREARRRQTSGLRVVKGGLVS